MRKFGYNIIYFIQLVRFFGLGDALRVAAGIIFPTKDSYQFTTKKLGRLSIRKNTSDLPIFYQVFCDLQYDIDFFLDFKPTRILDAGANVGFASLYFADKYSGAKILAVEAEERNFEQLKQNVQNLKRIQPVHAAAWYSNGPVHIKDSAEAEASFEVVEGETSAGKTFNGMTIEALMQRASFDEVDILKMDIEGAEYYLFKHDPHVWLQKTRCLIIELHDKLQPGTSRSFFTEMSKYNWVTYVKGENLVCIKQ
ncbi:MAG: FkbM family methyltransferase [Chitinophagaceae bacterium]|nr:MAG: FkbM family methyltransferase [Chitinophagaceae bacterium]